MADFLINNEGLRLRIKEIMDAMNMNASTFADTASITRSVVSNILNNQSNITIETINKILHAFPEWNKQWLLFGEGEARNKKTLTEDYTEHSLFSNFQAKENFESENQKNGTLLQLGAQQYFEALITKSIEKAIKENEKEKRKISEIRVYYDDGSYETFKLHQ